MPFKPKQSINRKDQKEDESISSGAGKYCFFSSSKSSCELFLFEELLYCVHVCDYVSLCNVSWLLSCFMWAMGIELGSSLRAIGAFR